MVQPSPGRPGYYDFRYRAGWDILRFGDYTHTVSTRLAGDGSMSLCGAVNLPGGLGACRVDGHLPSGADLAPFQPKSVRSLAQTSSTLARELKAEMRK